MNHRGKWWAPFVGWPLAFFGYLLAPLYAVTFGLLDKRLAKQYQQQLTADVRFAMAFLFTEHKAHFVPNEGIPFPPSFDWAYVTVAVNGVLLRFGRGRGEFGVHFAPVFAPFDWHDLSLVLCVVGQNEIQRRRFRDVWDVSRALRPHIQTTLQSISVDWFDELKRQLERNVYRHERVAIRQAESAINLRLYRNNR